MHTEALEWIRSRRRSIPQIGKALDIGGGGSLGDPVRDLFPTVWDVLDNRAAQGVTIVGDAATWDRKRRVWPLVVCTEVLEHSQWWMSIVGTAVDCMDPLGSHLLVTCAAEPRAPHGAHGEEHPPPGEWYRNINHLELAAVTLDLSRTWRLVMRNFTYDTTHGDLYLHLERP